MSTDAWLVFIGAMLLLFGIGYAWYITHSRVRPGIQCEGVAVGCAFTNAGFSIMMWIWTHDWRPIAAVWVCYALTGVPMLVFKRLQDEKRKEEATCYVDMLMVKRAERRPDAN